jgi:hypothetical protein
MSFGSEVSLGGQWPSSTSHAGGAGSNKEHSESGIREDNLVANAARVPVSGVPSMLLMLTASLVFV